jgi:peptidoglycan/xylan/chitin deacetylase (PgdA/CDA1 family)
MEINPVTLRRRRGVRALLGLLSGRLLCGATVGLLSLLLIGTPAAVDAAVSTAATSGAVVFMYHRFGEAAYPSTSIRLEQFDAQLQYLAEAGYRIWPLQRIVDHLRSGEAIPDRTVALTVDDAFRSVYTEAWPRLKRRGWPLTVFVATDDIDKHLPAFMSWAQMREMQRDGATFANHSASHDYLIRRKPGENTAAWRARVAADIARAQERLRQELGAAPTLFAYPYGEYSAALADVVKDSGFMAAFGQQSGAIGAGSDPRALPRYPMAETYADMTEFRAKAASLALPVRAAEPWDPVVTTAAAPRLRVKFDSSDVRLDGLNCFDNHGGKIEVEWNEKETGTAVFTVHDRRDLPPGRSRYNCTAPSLAQPARYYWFSHPWIRLGTP